MESALEEREVRSAGQHAHTCSTVWPAKYSCTNTGNLSHPSNQIRVQGCLTSEEHHAKRRPHLHYALIIKVLQVPAAEHPEAASRVVLALLSTLVQFVVHDGESQSCRVAPDSEAEQNHLHHRQCKDEQHHPATTVSARSSAESLTSLRHFTGSPRLNRNSPHVPPHAQEVLLQQSPHLANGRQLAAVCAGLAVYRRIRLPSLRSLATQL
jgi:hypothetical protein